MAEVSYLPVVYTLGAAVASGSTALGLLHYLRGRNRLIHSINRDLCVGCDKCVQRCPTQVLALDKEHKAIIERAQDCIDCRQCESVCKPQALVMHRRSEPPPVIERPDLDEHFQVRGREGLYLIGHAAGVPLVKNAVNLGRAAVEHLVRTPGFRRVTEQPLAGAAGVERFTAELDILIVGSGPAGLSAAMTCTQHGLRYLIFERSNLTNSTVQSYPVGKDIHSVPEGVACVGLLPMPSDKLTKQELTAQWQERLEASDVLRFIVKPAQVSEIRPLPASDQSPCFAVHVDNGALERQGPRQQVYRAQRVLLAIGESGPKNPLKVPGEELSLVKDSLTDPGAHRKQRLLVVGGGDSAVEAALALSHPELENRVVLAVRRGRKELRASLRNQERLEQRVKDRRLLILYECSVTEVRPGQVTLDLKQERRQRTLEVDALFSLIGNQPASEWLKAQGVRFTSVRQDLVRSRPTDQLVAQILRRPLEQAAGSPLADAAPLARRARTMTLAAAADSAQACTVLDPQLAERIADAFARYLAQQGVSVDAERNRLQIPPDSVLMRMPEPARDAELPRASRERKTEVALRRARLPVV